MAGSGEKRGKGTELEDYNQLIDILFSQLALLRYQMNTSLNSQFAEGVINTWVKGTFFVCKCKFQVGGQDMRCVCVSKWNCWE